MNASDTVPVPAIVIVFVAPVPDAVTPEPTKFKVVAAVDNAEPSSCTVTSPPDAAIVNVSVPAFDDSVILEPATIVRVSLLESAAIFD